MIMAKESRRLRRKAAGKKLAKNILKDSRGLSIMVWGRHFCRTCETAERSINTERISCSGQLLLVKRFKRSMPQRCRRCWPLSVQSHTLSPPPRYLRQVQNRRIRHYSPDNVDSCSTGYYY